MTCSICLEDIVIDSNITHCYHCNNKFHKKCIIKWTNLHENCPLCRQKLNVFKYFNYCDNNRYVIKFNKLDNDIILNDNIILNPKLQLICQMPKCWKTSEIISANKLPYYELLNVNDTKIYVDSYLRQIILNENIDIQKLNILKNINNYLILKTNQTLEYITSKFYYIMIDWIYELILEIKKIFYFPTCICKHTLIIDLTLILIKNLKLNQKQFQTAIIASFHIVYLMLDKNEITKDFLIYITDNSSCINLLNIYIYYLEYYINNNIIIIK